MTGVLLVSEAKGFGGAEIYLERLAGGLEKYAPVLAVPRHSALESWAGRMRKAGLSVHNTGFGWDALRDVTKRASESDIGLVHVNLPSTYDGMSGVLPWWVARGSGKPVVVTEHLTGIPRSRRRRWLKRKTHGRVRMVITVSEASRRALVAEGLEPDRVIAIPNGVPDPGPPLPLPDPGRLRVGVLASLEPRKRIDVVIRAVAACPDPKPVLSIAGEGALRGELQRLTNSLGLSGDSVRLVGTVEDPYTFLAEQHVVALASELEAMPLSLLEAMASGRGVLASDLPGMDEVVVSGETGRLLPAGDIDAWSAAVKALHTDPRGFGEWGANARRRYRARFTLEKSVGETVAVYDRVLGGGI